MDTFENKRRKLNSFFIFICAGIITGYLSFYSIQYSIFYGIVISYAIDALPIIIGFFASPLAGGFFGLILNTILHWRFFFPHFTEESYLYAVAILFLSSFTGFLIGYIPAKIKATTLRKKIAVIIFLSLCLGISDFSPIIIGRLLGRTRLFRYWLIFGSAAMSSLLFGAITFPIAYAVIDKKKKLLLLPVLFLCVAYISTQFISSTNTPRYTPTFENYILSDDPGISALAQSIRSKQTLSKNETICAYYEYVRDNIKYDIDPIFIGEYPQYPNETISLGFGDCEDKSILLISLLRNAGINASVHIQPQHALVKIVNNNVITYLDPTSLETCPFNI